MNYIYNYILKNSTLNDLFEACLENKNIAIVIDNNKIENLLDYLKDFILNNATKENLNQKINNLLISDNTIDIIKIKKFNLLKREILNNKKGLIKIFSSFIKKDYEGKSLNDLYSITKKSLEFKDKEFKYFCILNKFKLLKDSDKNEVINNIKNLIKGGYIKIFIKYKKFNKNKNFNIINKECNKEDIMKVKIKLSGILNNTFAFTPPIYYNKYTSDFEKENIYYKSYNENELLEVIKKINYKHNNEILNEITNIKWYKLNNLLNYKKILNKNKKLKDEYLKEERTIQKQYLENIENLNLFLNSFGFIKKVFKNEVLDEIKNKITNEEELYNYISYLKNILSSYEEYLIISNKIELLNIMQNNILNYCYDKIDNKKDLSEIIQFIPDYFLYKEIEINEIKNEIETNNYESVDYKINNLYLALNFYKDIVLKILKEHTYKNVNDFIKKNSIDIINLNYNEIIDNKFKKENYIILSKLYPITVIYENEFNKNKELIEKKFDIVIKSSNFLAYDTIYKKSSESLYTERLDKGITVLLSNLGYNIVEDRENKSILYVLGYKNKEYSKTLYINNGENFNVDDLIQLLNIVNKKKNITYIWYRNWWLNKGEEIENLQKKLNNN